MRPRDIFLYFLLTILIFSSIGVWLPFAIDGFGNGITEQTKQAFPGNLLTYYVGIFTIATIDRLLRIISQENYANRTTEVLLIICIIVAVIFLTFLAFRNLHHEEYSDAIKWCSISTIISFIMWWISKWHTIKSNPENALGGEP